MGRWDTLLDRFWGKVIVGDDDDCWIWIGAKGEFGYGRITTKTVRGKPVCVQAHRFSWELAHAKQIPPGLFICHECDQPRCVNPKHLWLGTALDNSHDAVAKGRTNAGRPRPKRKEYMWIVVVESPWHGDSDRNRRYLRDCLADCVRRGESPYASHGLLGDVLDDNDPEQRALALRACAAWRRKAERVVVYDDLGISPGMQAGIDDAKARRIRIEFRSLAAWKREVAA